MSEPFVQIGSIPGIGPLTTLTFLTGGSPTADDGSAAVTLPFSFNFFGTTHTTLNVGTNGWVMFGSTPATALTNETPGTSGAPTDWIAPLWDDWLHPNTTNGRWGVVGTAPNRIFIVEVGPGTRYSASGGTLFYQVWLYEGVNRKFSFRSTGNPVNALSATIGYEGSGTNFRDWGGCGVNCSTVPSGTTYVTQMATTPELTGSIAGFPRGAFAGTSVTANVTLRNLGVDTATSVISTVYLSANNILDANDAILGTVGPIDVVGGNVPVPATTTLTVPPGTPVGDYFVILEVDSPNDWIESINTDNIAVAADRLATAYDLQPTSIVSQNTIGANPGQPITFDVGIRDLGVPYEGPVELRIFASPDQIFDANDPRLGDVTVNVTAVANEVVQATVILPNLAPGSYFPIVVVDTPDLIEELNEFNNTASGGITFPTGPDFAITTVTIPAQAVPNSPVSITTRVDSAAVQYVGPVIYRLFASVNNVYDNNDTQLGQYTVNFNNDDYIDDIRSIVWPNTLPAGRYYVIGVVDPTNSIVELNENNNTRPSAGTAVNAVDFSVGATVTVAPLTVEAGNTVNVTATILSTGLSFTGNVPYRIYLSPNAEFDLADDPVHDGTIFLAGLPSVTLNTSFVVPSDIPVGQYRVIVYADPDDNTAEASEVNNWSSSGSALDVQGADLRVERIAGASTAFIGLPYTVSLTIENEGIRDARAFRYAYYVSENDIIRVTDTQVFVSQTTTVAAGQMQSFVDEITLPVFTSSQAVYIGVILDIFSDVPEDSENNNIGVIGHEVAVVFPIPNLAGEIINTATAAAAGEQLAVTRIVLNNGVAPANNFTYSYYFSTNPAITTDDRLIGTFTSSLVEGADDFSIDLLTVPSDLPAGTYYLGMIIDPADLIDEVAEDDNAIVGPAIPVFEAAIRILTDSLPNATLGVPYQVGVYARGGPVGITWEVFSGTLPAGLTLDQATGIVSGTPTEEGLSIFILRALSGTAYAQREYQLRVTAPTVQIRVVSDALPTGIVGRAYETELIAVGGIVPYTWELVSQDIPGLTLAENGVLSGTPAAPGGNRLIVRVTDSLGNAASKEVALNVITAGQTLVISQLPLPSAVVFFEYCGDEMINFEATGGVMPYSWSIVGPGAPGMSLSAEGALCGVPETAGSFPLEIRVQDGTGLFDTALFILEVDSGSELAIATFELPAGEVGKAYDATVTAVRGEEPYVWSLIEDGGALPAGLSFSEGRISGTPSAAGVFAFRVQVVDARLRTDVQSLSVVIEPAPEIIEGGDDGCSCEEARSQTNNSAATWLVLIAVGALLTLRSRRSMFEKLGLGMALALIAGPSAALAQTQIPGTPYTRSTTSRTYVPTTGCTPLSFLSPDEGEATVTLPFAFKYYDNEYTQITVGTNGAIVFAAGADITYTNQAAGSGALNNFLAPFWDDLEINPGGYICTLVEGTAPNRSFVIEWANVGQFLNNSVSVNFQVRLSEGAAGQILLDYGPIVGASWSATMAMEDSAGQRPILIAASNCTTTCTGTDFTALTNRRVELIQDPGIELVATTVAGPRFAFLGAQTPVTIGVANLHGEVIGPFGVRVIASNTPNLANPVTVYTSSITLNPFQSTVQAVQGVFPASLGEGLAYVGLIVDSGGAIAEVNENNNSVTGSAPVRLMLGAPDLAITRIVTQATGASAGENVTVSISVTNVGGEPSGQVTVAVMLSTNPVVAPQDAELTRYTVDLAAGATDSRDISVTIPANANSGVFFLGALADPENMIDELSESNNGLATPTTITITGGPISIVTTQLPVGYVRQSYVGLLNAVGGTAMRNWTITSGTLPTGLGLVAGTGEIYGRPSREESQTFTVSVESDFSTDTQVLTLNVVEPESPLTIVTRSVPAAIIGQEYEFEIVTTGGTDGSTLTWTASGLPDGLVFAEEGVIRGTPTMEGDYTLTLDVTDGTQNASREILLAVVPNANLLIVPVPMPHAVYGEPYSFQIATTGGIAPITFLIELGQLPIGLELSPTGLIAGTPMEIGSGPFRIVVEARDAAIGNAQAKDVNTFELVVDDVAGFTVSTSALPEAFLNEGYTETIKAMGGTPPYTWSVDGDLPPGLSASTNPETNELLLAGQPNQLGLFTLTLKVTDVEGRTAGRALAVKVSERPVEIVDMTDDGGCGCATTSSSSSSYGALAFLAIGALLLSRKRRS